MRYNGGLQMLKLFDAKKIYGECEHFDFVQISDGFNYVYDNTKKNVLNSTEYYLGEKDEINKGPGIGPTDNPMILVDEDNLDHNEFCPKLIKKQIRQKIDNQIIWIENQKKFKGGSRRHTKRVRKTRRRHRK